MNIKRITTNTPLENITSISAKHLKMKKNILIPLFCLFTFFCTEAQAQEFSIQVNNRNRPYIIRLPQNYEDDTSGPIPQNFPLGGKLMMQSVT